MSCRILIDLILIAVVSGVNSLPAEAPFADEGDRVPVVFTTEHAVESKPFKSRGHPKGRRFTGYINYVIAAVPNPTLGTCLKP